MRERVHHARSPSRSRCLLNWGNARLMGQGLGAKQDFNKESMDPSLTPTIILPAQLDDDMTMMMSEPIIGVYSISRPSLPSSSLHDPDSGYTNLNNKRLSYMYPILWNLGHTRRLLQHTKEKTQHIDHNNHLDNNNNNPKHYLGILFTRPQAQVITQFVNSAYSTNPIPAR